MDDEFENSINFELRKLINDKRTKKLFDKFINEVSATVKLESDEAYLKFVYGINIKIHNN